MEQELAPKPKVDPTKVATPQQTLESQLELSGRDAAPIRRLFVQRKGQPDPEPGLLSSLVSKRDHRGVLLYLLIMSLASQSPWDVTRPNRVWARALGMDPSKDSSTVAISRATGRLKTLHLIDTERSARQAKITILREDGSKQPYTHPGKSKEPYLKLPFAFWTDGWHEKLELPAVAMLLILRSLPRDTRLALDNIPRWYGISRPTAVRGLTDLRDQGLLNSHWVQQPDHLKPQGYRWDLHHNLLGKFALPSRPEPSAAVGRNKRPRGRKASGKPGRR